MEEFQVLRAKIMKSIKRSFRGALVRVNPSCRWPSKGRNVVLQHRKNNSGDIEMGIGARTNLNKIFEDVAKINKNLKEKEKLYSILRVICEETNMVHNARVGKALPSKMKQGVSWILKRAKLILDQLKVLENSNEVS
ncbi:hypothetical protein RDABS01_015591 [Bienertia sinuspersici]